MWDEQILVLVLSQVQIPWNKIQLRRLLTTYCLVVFPPTLLKFTEATERCWKEGVTWRWQNVVADFRHTNVTTTTLYSYETVNERLKIGPGFLYPAIHERAQGHTSKAIGPCAKLRKYWRNPFLSGSFVMVLDPTCSGKTRLRRSEVLKKNKGGTHVLLDSDNTLSASSGCLSPRWYHQIRCTTHSRLL